jgi:hypothetical protein
MHKYQVRLINGEQLPTCGNFTLGGHYDVVVLPDSKLLITDDFGV